MIDKQMKPPFVIGCRGVFFPEEMGTSPTGRGKKGQYETERDSARTQGSARSKGTKGKEVNKKVRKRSYVVKCCVTRLVYRSQEK
jgi:hypothetical protein